MISPFLFDRTVESSAAGSTVQRLLGRELQGYDEFRAAAALYVTVFQYEAPEFALNPNLLSALSQNGGSAVGVFTAEDELVGFAYGFAGRDRDGTEFHYSQAATVDPRFQGRGVGRTLKLLQALVAKQWGHRTMRWTFDPALARNAHFNFDSLGAVGIDYLPDYYAREGTDRILVEWQLGEAQQLQATQRPQQAQKPERAPSDAAGAPLLGRDEWGTASTDGDDIWIALPAEVQPPSADTTQFQTRLAGTLSEVFASGRVLVGCTRINDDTAAYRAVPRRGKDTE